MHHNHRNLIIPTYDTEVLEKALEEACNGNIQIRHRLEIRNLAISLWYDAELKKQGTTNQQKTAIPSDSGFGRVFMVAGAGFEPATFRL